MTSLRERPRSSHTANERAVEHSQLTQRSGHVRIHQRRAAALNGWLGVLGVAACTAGAILLDHSGLWILAPIVPGVLLLSGLWIVAPGQMAAVQFFGSYVGTLEQPGFWLAIPLTVKRGVSIRVRNFETAHLKVNDAAGNPIEMAAIVVWQVVDTARAVYAVDDYPGFVRVQSEAALRHVASGYPYDADPGVTSLRGSSEQVVDQLSAELAQRVAVAGVEVVEVRISHLAYAPEIAQAMLRRQQAAAVVAARSRIVEGAVGMVEMALTRLADGGVVELDDEHRAAMVANLMVVLCGDQPPAPMVNTSAGAG